MGSRSATCEAMARSRAKQRSRKQSGFATRTGTNKRCLDKRRLSGGLYDRFRGHSAPEFFGKLESAQIGRLLDVRLNNSSQLAGFTKRSDLPFFLDRVGNIEYRRDLELAPTSDMLAAYRAKQIPWAEYERRSAALLAERHIEDDYTPAVFERRTVLLCSEPTARQCHRRLVLEYLRSTSIPSLEAIHL